MNTHIKMNRSRFGRFMACILCFIVSFTCIPLMDNGGGNVNANTPNQNYDLKIKINGQLVQIDTSLGEPFIDENNRTQIPLRGVMEKLNCDVYWDESSKTAEVRENGITVKVPIGENYILVNDVIKANDTTALIKDGRVYMPIRVVLEAFNYNVGWNYSTKTVSITQSDTGTNDNSIDAFISEVIEIVNKHRISNGLRPLSRSAGLTEVAKFRAEDMADNNYFSHISPYYGEMTDLYDKFDITWSYCGENIACGQRNPQDVTESWMNSSGHRENILDTDYKYIGVGVARNSNGTYYWVLEFTG